MDVNITPTWKAILEDEFEKEYFYSLTAFVKEAYDTSTCYPPKEQVFAALNQTPFPDVRVVIIGQDPYHGPGQANGLCFSVADDMQHPPSLRNIFKELENDIGITIPRSGNLERWAQQGVLLLNATLTVKAHEAGSHQKKGWEQFTDAIIASISEKRAGVVFLLWGGYAKKKGSKIDATKHLVLSSGHPSPLSANRGYWFKNKHFSAANDYFKLHAKKPIYW
jgi:uracil-DNA glycosylase